MASHRVRRHARLRPSTQPARDVFEWRRLIDIGPPGPFPDAGRMRWESRALVEVGVHED